MQRQTNPHRPRGPDSETAPSPSATLKNFRKHLEGAFSEARNLLRAWNDLKEKNERQASELQEKQAYIDRLERKLDECISQILRSLNVFKVSDYGISERLNDIYHVLFNWVTQLPHITQFPRDWPKAKALLQAKGYTGSSEFDIDAENMEHLHFELMTFHIFRVLWKHLFMPRWAGVDASTKNRLEQIYQDMHKLDPKIGLYPSSKDISRPLTFNYQTRKTSKSGDPTLSEPMQGLLSTNSKWTQLAIE